MRFQCERIFHQMSIEDNIWKALISTEKSSRLQLNWIFFFFFVIRQVDSPIWFHIYEWKFDGSLHGGWTVFSFIVYLFCFFYSAFSFSTVAISSMYFCRAFVFVKFYKILFRNEVCFLLLWLIILNNIAFWWLLFINEQMCSLFTP